ncbi:uncharacterized protein LOC135840906 isoform X2 [Planococcus citri]|uniref:uncharacterized protein LOC135840906 isoform X2 n=1 Tax=Planococcus citri TaxID=170843 RepID=UPI0031F8812E
MVERAFLSANNYLQFFKEIDDIYTAKDDAINNIFAEINLAYGHLLQDDEEPQNSNEFLIPEIPKNKKETKEKPESSRMTRKKASLLNETVGISAEKVDSTNDPDAFRRSSRIASKKIPQRLSSACENIEDESSINASRSPAQPLSQSKQKYDTKNKDSTNTEDSMKFLAHSTPLTLSPFDEKNDVNSGNKTPNDKIASILKLEEKPNSVKKRVEELEKRPTKGIIPNKLPMKTPDKKKNAQVEKPRVDNAPVCKSRLLRSNRTLKDIKNANVETSQSQVIEIKKPTRFKNNPNTGNKIKMGIGSKATNQRLQEADENSNSPKLEKKINEKSAPPKKYFNQIKVKDVKTQKTNSSNETSQNDDSTREQEAKQAESRLAENAQYELDHVLENESSEDEECPKKQIPLWATKEMREYPLHVQAWIDKKETVYPWFFNKNIKNPKLEELFSVAIKMRPRTSSAVWTTKTHLK